MQKRYAPERDSFNDNTHKLVLHPDHIDDVMLWKAFRSGNEKALIVIFERLNKPIYSYGFKITGDSELVKDAIQELFIEIWQNRSRLSDTTSIKFYLFKSLRRKLIRLMNKRENRLFGRLTIAHDNETSPSHEFVMISEQVSSEQREGLMRILSKLSARQHEAIFLRYFEELNCEQIAEIMKLRKQVVYNLIHDALTKLKKIIREDPSAESQLIQFRNLLANERS